jgi:SPP1 gp7 family putative phage head morphogenesis protein
VVHINYWERRAVEEETQVQNNVTHAARVVNAAYNESEQYLLDEYIKLLKRMKQRTGWDNERIHEFLSQKASDTELADLVRLKQQTTDKAVLKQVKARLNAEALKFRISRLDVIKAKAHIVAMQTLPVHKQAMDNLLTGTVRDAYFSGQGEVIARQALDGDVKVLSEPAKYTAEVGSYKGKAYHLDVEQQKAKLKELPTKDVDRVVNRSWSGNNYSARIWGNTERLAERLEKLFTMKELASMSERDMAKVLAYEFKVGRGIAERLIRTEANRVYNLGKLMGWRKHFPDGEYRFVAVLDRRTSQVCRDHDGKIYKVAKAKVGDNLPPLHPWCRSTVVLWFGASEWQTTRQVPNPIEPDKLITIDKRAGWAGVEAELRKQQKRLEAPKPYVSVKDEWLRNKKEAGTVIEAEYYEHNGIRYSENLVYDHDEYEIGISKWLGETFGGKIELIPRVVIPKGVSTPDFMFRGERLDLKRINSEGRRVIDGAIKNKKKQAENFILDFTDSKLTDDEIMKQLTSVFGNHYRSWIKMMILIRDGKIIDIIKRA